MAPSGQPRWQKAALCFCAASFASFVANLTFTIWAVTRPWSNVQDGVGILSDQYSCSTAKNINTGIHVVINAISTVLLAGSNYCMQFLSAPTRKQIDKAHQESRWVDIGVPSFRNLLSVISWGNAIIWALLSLSSVPLHLFYNSAVFTSISCNRYVVFTVNEAFMTIENRTSLPPYLQTSSMKAMYQAALEGRLERLERDACFEAYASNYQSVRGDLLLVHTGTDLPATNSHSSRQSGIGLELTTTGCDIFQAYGWMCNGLKFGHPQTSCPDEIPGLRDDLEHWTPFGYPVKECYSLPTAERCKLLFSPTLCWLVTILNLLKALLMLVAALRFDTEPLLTVGDAVASFMRFPDESTRGLCLTSKNDITESVGNWRGSCRLLSEFKRVRKFGIASVGRWVICVLLFSCALCTCLGLLVYGLQVMQGARDLSTVMGLGLGTLSNKTLIEDQFQGSGWTLLLSNVVLANCPQAVMSLLYFTYNGLFTNIALGTEWDSYASKRKGLRVSTSRLSGAQRSTYFLQLPYRYSIPLLTFSGLLHWLISQSIFLVFIEVYQNPVDESLENRDTEMTHTMCGWSPPGLISVIIIGGFMIIFLVATGCQRLSSETMPVAGSCSAAISAACHQVSYDEHAWKEPLQWGAVHFEGDEMGHCSFSNSEVEPLREGVVYI
ncbi:hypothetical protein MMYC01_202482 [Madurella mycetomatis]|uniref:DUF6536 domain-containing protein n=1 Tax=Madurella mycetomatis TaxID=100816 RepID=A0A175WEE3_9PEZI|nr:hypothetical protein MMYC01_202482 [Madurella mycetomatis]